MTEKYTGIKWGGNPPDAGSIYVDGVQVAWAPVELKDNPPTEREFAAIWLASRSKGVLSRRDVAALLRRRVRWVKCTHDGDYHYRTDQYGEQRPVCHSCNEDLEL